MQNKKSLPSTVYRLLQLRKSVVGRRKSLYWQTGQSLTEVIVASVVSILVVAALTYATIFSLRNASFAKNSAQATKLAQEALERVRSARDRSSAITIQGVSTVDSWSNDKPIWNYHISGNCDMPDLLPEPGYCYFKINSATGALTNIGTFGQTTFPEALAEGIPSSKPVFYRVVLLSDDLNHDKIFSNDDYQNQKEVTVIVRWKDFAGDHESKLTTILRKL